MSGDIYLGVWSVPRRGGTLNLLEVRHTVDDAQNTVENLAGLVRRGRGHHLYECGCASVGEHGGYTKYTVGLRGFLVVGGYCLQGLRVLDVLKEFVDVQTCFLSHLGQHFELVDSLALHVPGVKKRNVEFLEFFSTLLLGGFARLEGKETAAREGLVLLPKLPVGAFFGVDLL